jgi:hypothetical protein
VLSIGSAEYRLLSFQASLCSARESQPESIPQPRVARCEPHGQAELPWETVPTNQTILRRSQTGATDSALIEMPQQGRVVEAAVYDRRPTSNSFRRSQSAATMRA